MTTVGSIGRDHPGRNLHRYVPREACRDVSSFHSLVYTVALFNSSKTNRKRKSKVLLTEECGHQKAVETPFTFALQLICHMKYMLTALKPYVRFCVFSLLDVWSTSICVYACICYVNVHCARHGWCALVWGGHGVGWGGGMFR